MKGGAHTCRVGLTHEGWGSHMKGGARTCRVGLAYEG